METAAFRAGDAGINRDDIELNANKRHGINTGADN